MLNYCGGCYKIWIRQHDNTEDINQINVVHPSKFLDIISRYGHSLPDSIKDDLTERGFDFSRRSSPHKATKSR